VAGHLADGRRFDAILINRRGYADSGAELERAIARELGASPIVGSDGRLAFFSLVEHARRLHAGLSAAALERQRDLAQHPIVMRFTSGCSGIEHGKAGDFRWCGAIGEIDIDNDARVEQAATLATGLFAGKPPTKVTIEGDLLAETVDIPASGQPFVRTLRVARVATGSASARSASPLTHPRIRAGRTSSGAYRIPGWKRSRRLREWAAKTRDHGFVSTRALLLRVYGDEPVMVEAVLGSERAWRRIRLCFAADETLAALDGVVPEHPVRTGGRPDRPYQRARGMAAAAERRPVLVRHREGAAQPYQLTPCEST